MVAEASTWEKILLYGRWNMRSVTIKDIIFHEIAFFRFEMCQKVTLSEDACLFAWMLAFLHAYRFDIWGPFLEGPENLSGP